MGRIKIFTVGTPVLRKKASAVTEEEKEEYQKLVKSMTNILKTANGLGLAAPQVGISKRIFIVDTGYIEYDKVAETANSENISYVPSIKVFLNPQLISGEGSQSIEEGCLSVPEYRAEVERYDKIKIKYYDIDFKEHRENIDGLFSIVFQHELDHLNGILFIDHLSRLKRNMARKKAKKNLKQYMEDRNETKIRLYGLS